MDWLHLIYQLPAVAAGTALVAYLLPWKLPPRFAPLLMFAVALAIMKLPVWIDVSLALTIPAAWLQAKLGIDLHSHEPLKIKLPQLRLTRLPVQSFAARAYPPPGEVSGDTPAEQEEHDTGQVPGQREGPPRSFVPSLLG